LEERARKEADDNAWSEALRAGTATAFTTYLRSFGSGAHAEEAQARLAVVDVQARKEADEKAWAEALRVGNTPAFKAYLQNFGSGAHTGEARRRITALAIWRAI
jgi:hypothetical protein